MCGAIPPLLLLTVDSKQGQLYLLLLSVNHCGIIFMNVCSGVVTVTLILSAGFDVLTPVNIKGVVCCDVTPVHCVELRHCFQNEKPAVPVVRAEEHTSEQRIGQVQAHKDRDRLRASPFLGTPSASESLILPLSLLPFHKDTFESNLRP